MNVFSFLSMLNIGMTVILVVLSSYRLGLSTDTWRRQIVATPIFLGIALLVMHIIGLITYRPDLHDIETLSWRLLDFLSLITMVRLIKAIPLK